MFRQLFKLLATVLMLFSLLGCTNCTSPKANPEPIDDLCTLVKDRANQWLDARMDDSAYNLFENPQAGWRAASSFQEIQLWFDSTFQNTAYWNFMLMIEQIRDSQLYRRGPPSDSEFFQLVYNSLLAYKYEGD